MGVVCVHVPGVEGAEEVTLSHFLVGNLARLDMILAVPSSIVE